MIFDPDEILPSKGETVEVQTVWDDVWHKVTFKGRVSSIHPEKGYYDWFGVYSAPDDGAKIVTYWRYP